MAGELQRGNCAEAAETAEAANTARESSHVAFAVLQMPPFAMLPLAMPTLALAVLQFSGQCQGWGLLPPGFATSQLSLSCRELFFVL